MDNPFLTHIPNLLLKSIPNRESINLDDKDPPVTIFIKTITIVLNN